jgi:hypothetical protein
MFWFLSKIKYVFELLKIFKDSDNILAKLYQMLLKWHKFVKKDFLLENFILIKNILNSLDKNKLSNKFKQLEELKYKLEIIRKEEKIDRDKELLWLDEKVKNTLEKITIIK